MLICSLCTLKVIRDQKSETRPFLFLFLIRYKDIKLKYVLCWMEAVLQKFEYYTVISVQQLWSQQKYVPMSGGTSPEGGAKKNGSIRA